MMKKMNFLEINGFILMVLGFILMALNGKVENEFLTKLTIRYELFYWGGMVLWASGYVIREQKNKKQK